MKASHRRNLGMLMVGLGLLTVVFSEKIVFPGLEVLLGIETIVGRQYVHYFDDGSYVFTNPGSMIKWVLTVAAVGLATFAVGLRLWWVSRTRGTDS